MFRRKKSIGHLLTKMKGVAILTSKNTVYATADTFTIGVKKNGKAYAEKSVKLENMKVLNEEIFNSYKYATIHLNPSNSNTTIIGNCKHLTEPTDKSITIELDMITFYMEKGAVCY